MAGEGLEAGSKQKALSDWFLKFGKPGFGLSCQRSNRWSIFVFVPVDAVESVLIDWGELPLTVLVRPLDTCPPLLNASHAVVESIAKVTQIRLLDAVESIPQTLERCACRRVLMRGIVSQTDRNSL